MKNKKQLYKNIINDISKIVKKELNENNQYNQLSIEQSKENFIKQLIKLPINKLKKLCSYNLDESIYTDNATDILLNKFDCKELTKNIIDFSFNNIDDIISAFIIVSADIKNFTEILKRYKLKEKYQFTIRRINDYDIDFIDMILNKNETNIINELKNCGFYYNIRPLIEPNEKINKQFSDEQLTILNDMIFVRFLPLNQDNIKNIILENSKYIYHYTYEENLESIKNTGLKINNISHPLYPKRLFFITNIKTNTNISFNNYEKYLIDRLILNYRLNYKTNKTPNIYKISIDLNKLPNNIKFYIDINSYPYAIYTDSNIPKQYLNISKNKINIK